MTCGISVTNDCRFRPAGLTIFRFLSLTQVLNRLSVLVVREQGLPIADNGGGWNAPPKTLEADQGILRVDHDEG